MPIGSVRRLHSRTCIGRIGGQERAKFIRRTGRRRPCFRERGIGCGKPADHLGTAGAINDEVMVAVHEELPSIGGVQKRETEGPVVKFRGGLMQIGRNPCLNRVGIGQLHHP